MGINAAHNDFLLTIQSVYPSLTKAEKKVADYILQNPKGVPVSYTHLTLPTKLEV